MFAQIQSFRLDHLIFKVYKHFMEDSLYRNSIYLILSTAVMSVFGFLFWTIVARVYTPEQIGIATSLISVTALITKISMLGFNNAILKYYPVEKNKSDLINTSFTLILVTTIIISIIYLIGIDYFSPALAFVNSNLLMSIGFIIIMSITSINSVSDSVFIADRNSFYVFIYNSIMNIPKIILPLILIPIGALGIYLATFGGILTAFIITFILLFHKNKYLYYPSVNKIIAKKMVSFSVRNYVANFINGLPSMILPLLVLNKLGPKFAAYYYIAMIIANVIYLIPSTITLSFFAEGANNEQMLKRLVFQTIKITLLFLVPAVVLVVFFGEYILLVFGKEFSAEALALLKILTLSALFLPINSTGSTILNIKGQLNTLTYLCIVNAVVILVPLYLMPTFNLLTVGYLWFLSNGIVCLLTIFLMLKYIKK